MRVRSWISCALSSSGSRLRGRACRQSLGELVPAIPELRQTLDLPAPGQLQFELGVLVDRFVASHRPRLVLRALSVAVGLLQ